MGRRQYCAPEWDVLRDCGLNSFRGNCAFLGSSTSRRKPENSCGFMLFVAEKSCGIFNAVIMSLLNESKVISLLAEKITLFAQGGLLSVEPLSCLQTRHSSFAVGNTRRSLAIGNTWRSLAVGNKWSNLAVRNP